MTSVLVTGSAGLVGSTAVRFFTARGYRVFGVDNDLRREFFGEAASTRSVRESLEQECPDYVHRELDIRDQDGLTRLFTEVGGDLEVVVHCAAQPSHDWAARDPLTDFGVNALATLGLLECARKLAPGASFVFASTNKVYGDRPNSLPLIEHETRFEVDPSHRFARGIDESMSIDATRHSVFGASKAAADLMVQEYGRYFGMNTACFRAGCITGPSHAGAELHGFLSYLMRSVIEGRSYSVFGYSGKQVRDNIHAEDLVNAFWHWSRDPRPADVFNIGGGRFSHCSMLEAIEICEEVAGAKLDWHYDESARIGDHIWWVSDVSRFQKRHPDWKPRHDLRDIIAQIHARWSGAR